MGIKKILFGEDLKTISFTRKFHRRDRVKVVKLLRAFKSIFNTEYEHCLHIEGYSPTEEYKKYGDIIHILEDLYPLRSKDPLQRNLKPQVGYTPTPYTVHFKGYANRYGDNNGDKNGNKIDKSLRVELKKLLNKM